MSDEKHQREIFDFRGTTTMLNLNATFASFIYHPIIFRNYL
ncbi:hypothetical protein NC99_13180 [Sunxiuqinia dokdonensis]|uniref:Uncharacterized protein n=1 Tax=Sunxiuqinia dokdonensis TaxID=1409788 RepID=A0A0L8VBQ3_9BACT|nr:hypothetical protein NC99_13180 [Sunxiuqinia dokdonensis]